MPGVAAYGALRGAAVGRAGGRGGRPAVMLLPPNAYRADEEAVLEHYREVAKVGLPIVAYNNPIDTKVDLTPPLLARLHGEGLIVGVKEFTGDVRRAYEIAELAPGLDVLIGSDDVGARAGPGRRRRAGSPASPTRCRARASSCTRAARGDLDDARCRSTGGCTRCCAGTPRPSSCRRSSCRWTSPAATAARAARRAAARCPTTRRRSARTPRRPLRRRWLSGADARTPRPPRGRLAHRGHADPGHHRRRRRDPRRDHGRATHVLHRAHGRPAHPARCTSRAGTPR